MSYAIYGDLMVPLVWDIPDPCADYRQEKVPSELIEWMREVSKKLVIIESRLDDVKFV